MGAWSYHGTRLEPAANSETFLLTQKNKDEPGFHI
jgi:hypothetical protein